MSPTSFRCSIPQRFAVSRLHAVRLLTHRILRLIVPVKCHFRVHPYFLYVLRTRRLPDHCSGVGHSSSGPFQHLTASTHSRPSRERSQSIRRRGVSSPPSCSTI